MALDAGSDTPAEKVNVSVIVSYVLVALKITPSKTTRSPEEVIREKTRAPVTGSSFSVKLSLVMGFENCDHENVTSGTPRAREEVSKGLVKISGHIVQ